MGFFNWLFGSKQESPICIPPLPQGSNSFNPPKAKKELSAWTYDQDVVARRTLAKTQVKEMMVRLGTFKPDSSEWITDLVNLDLINGRGPRNLELVIRKMGEPLTKEQLKVLGLRGNTIVGSKYLEALTPKGLENIKENALKLVCALNAHSSSEAQIASFKAEKLHLDGHFGLKILPVPGLCCKVAESASKRLYNAGNCPTLPLLNCDVDICRCCITPTSKDIERLSFK